MKIRLFTLLLLYINLTFGQIKDSVSVEAQKVVNFQNYSFKNSTTRVYQKPKWLDMFTKASKNFIGTAKGFVQNGNIWYTGGAIATTAVLVPIDQKLIENIRNFADGLGLSPSNSYGKFGPLQNIPQNIGAGMYLFGNGTTVILMGAGFLTYGLLKNDYRAQATASGLIESMIVSGVYVQAIKRITGRESPFVAIANGNPGGDWNPFPSFSAYAKNTPNYDAVPSGHLTTIMSALTVITTNYPDYKWIKPVGYTLVGGLCFQMMQSEVHWASDYPLALLVGYISGKTIAKSRFTEKTDLGFNKNPYKLEITASNQWGYNTFGLSLKF